MNDLEQHTDILSLIRVRMSGLSKGHKRIAEYILANYVKPTARPGRSAIEYAM